MQDIFFKPTQDFPLAILIVVMVWSLYWKGRALWTASKKDQKYWFVALLIVNSVGILEIVYLVFFQKGAKIDLRKKFLPPKKGKK